VSTGNIDIGYLGTKPPIAAIGGVKRDLDYDKLDEEHRKLLQVSLDMPPPFEIQVSSTCICYLIAIDLCVLLVFD
jgi:hypothetical protein